MLNYSLNEGGSKKFIKYYKEKDDSITIHYADNTKIVVENTEEMKKKLNRIEEEQIEAFNDSNFKSDIPETIQASFGLAFCGSCMISLGGAMLGIIFWNLSTIVAIAKYSTLLYAPAAALSVASVVYGLSSRKFNLFLEYKDRINKYLESKNTEEEVVNTNTNNPVVKPKKVKNLCINDVNFMTYRQIKKMTKAIDKEEDEKEKYEALGIDGNKVLIKRYN